MRLVLALTGLLALAVGGLVYFQQVSLQTITSVWHPALPAMDAAPPPRPAVPVVVARARSETVPIFLSGIGTVQAYSTVNIRTQVDGQISQILFRKGRT